MLSILDERRRFERRWLGGSAMVEIRFVVGKKDAELPLVDVGQREFMAKLQRKLKFQIY